MTLYYDEFICSDCGRKLHADEDAARCPYCGRPLYRVRSGGKKTISACRTAAKLGLGVSSVALLAAIVLGSGALFWFAVTSLVISSAAICNAAREQRRVAKAKAERKRI